MIFQLTANYKKLTDDELMLKVKKGEDKAFEELYRRYARRLQGFFYRMLGNDREMAADFTQELFERIWTYREKYDEAHQVSAWLYTMAYNICRNEYRHREVEDNYIWQLSGEEEAMDSPVESQLDAEAFDRALSEILAALPSEPRMLFALRYEEELPLSEIAEIMHLPVGTVKSRNHYLIALIKQKLHHYERIR